MSKQSSNKKIKYEIISGVNEKIIQCKKCPRLSSYVRHVAKTKVKRHLGEKYWGRPLSGFGDVNARLLLIGLAPAAHGGNRTGRMFTGDSSGDWLARALHENGFATKPTSTHLDDGFSLTDSYITAAVKCAPPQNKPTKQEIDTCSDFLRTEIALLRNVRVIVCLGKIAFDSLKKITKFGPQKFSHGNYFTHNNVIVLCSYHPSRQNTQTGRLTWNQWNKIFLMAKNLIMDSSVQ